MGTSDKFTISHIAFIVLTLNKLAPKTSLGKQQTFHNATTGFLDFQKSP